MKISGQYLWTDYLDAQLLHLTPPRATRISLWLLGAMLAVSIISMLLLRVPIEYGAACLVPVLILVGLYALYRYLIMPRQVKRIFNQQKELNSPFEIEFSEAGLSFSNEFGQTLRPWQMFLKWKENEKIFMLYHSDVMFSMFPKRLFTDGSHLLTIKHFLNENGVSSAPRKLNHIQKLLIYLLIIIAIGGSLYVLFAPNP